MTLLSIWFYCLLRSRKKEESFIQHFKQYIRKKEKDYNKPLGASQKLQHLFTGKDAWWKLRVFFHPKRHFFRSRGNVKNHFYIQGKFFSVPVSPNTIAMCNQNLFLVIPKIVNFLFRLFAKHVVLCSSHSPSSDAGM